MEPRPSIFCLDNNIDPDFYFTLVSLKDKVPSVECTTLNRHTIYRIQTIGFINSVGRRLLQLSERSKLTAVMFMCWSVSAAASWHQSGVTHKSSRVTMPKSKYNNDTRTTIKITYYSDYSDYKTIKIELLYIHGI